MMNFLLDVRTALVFLAMISVLVAAHEYGHYLFARIFGMGVEEFAIGMGKKLTIWKRKTYDIPVGRDYVHDEEQVSKGALFEGGNRASSSQLIDTPEGKVLRERTEFTVRMLPIGGFVRIKGMIPQDDGSEVGIPGGFYSKPPWQRFIVLLAGPVASVLSGIIVLIAVFMIHGAPRIADRALIGDVSKDSIAEKAGLQKGDRIVAVNDKPISGLYPFVHTINISAGKRVKLSYVRGSGTGSVFVVPQKTKLLPLSPDLKPAEEPSMQGGIGITVTRELKLLGFAEATSEAFYFPVEAVKGLLRIAKQPSVIKDEAGGALTMVAATHEATQEGLGQTMILACLISISVGIFNLLPIPPLDGGQMVMAIAEMLRGGRRLSIQVQQALMNAGVFLVLLLAVFVLFIDIQRFTGGGNTPKPVEASAKK